MIKEVRSNISQKTALAEVCGRMLPMLERDFKRARLLPENQDPVKQLAIEKAYRILENAGVKDLQEDAPVPTSETTKLSEFIFDNTLFTYHPERGRTVFIKKDNRRVKLTFTENEVLEVMARKAGRVAGFKEFAHIWETTSFHNTLKHHVHRVRYILGDEKKGKQFSMIKSVRGVGYILSTSVDLQEENQHSKKEFGQRNTSQPEVTIYERQQDVAFQDPNKEIVYRYSSGLIIYPERNKVAIGDEYTSLTNKENKLLQILAENQSKVLSREEIAQRLWGWIDEDMLSDKYDLIKNYIRHVRRKIKDKKVEGEDNFNMIQTVHGRGYMWVEPGNLQLSPAA